MSSYWSYKSTIQFSVHFLSLFQVLLNLHSLDQVQILLNSALIYSSHIQLFCTNCLAATLMLLKNYQEERLYGTSISLGVNARKASMIYNQHILLITINKEDWQIRWKSIFLLLFPKLFLSGTKYTVLQETIAKYISIFSIAHYDIIESPNHWITVNGKYFLFQKLPLLSPFHAWVGSGSKKINLSGIPALAIITWAASTTKSKKMSTWLETPSNFCSRHFS